jgi:hypothetical protein
LSSFGFSKLAVDFEARDLGGGRRSQRDRFADPLGDVVYPLYFGEQIEWGTGALTLEGTFKQLIRLGDDHPLYAPSFYWMVKGLYKINDFIVPKLGFEYIMNSLAWENEIDMRFDKSLEWEDCEKDKSGLGVLAAVEFRIGGGTLNVIELGYSLKADTSTDAKPDVRTATLDQAVYAAIKISR